ncbi:hypothetical protein ScPMuIL_010986 [Solemya velum]
MANRKRSMQHSESYLISFVGDDIEHTDLAPGRDDLPLMSVISETSFASGMMKPKVFCCVTFVAFIGAALMTTGLVLYFWMPTIVDSLVESEAALTKDSVMFEDWSELKIPMVSEFYVFHVVNPEEVVNGSKPVVEERGPYVYRQRLFRDGIVFNDDGTVSYDLRQSFYFERNLSVGSETDTFTTLNIPAVAVNHGMRHMPSLTRMFAEAVLLLDEEPLFLELSVKDFLWGYQDAFINRMSLILPTVGQDFSDHFGLLYQKNGTKMGSYRIASGANDISKLGEILTWNGLSTLTQWGTDQCRMINGSDGTIFPPLLDRNRTLYFYNPFYCRSLPLVYESDSEVKDLATYQFVVPSSAFASPDQNLANEGFCTPLGNCPPSGMINISHCNSGGPVLLSQPHFRDADPALQNSVLGLQPDPENHRTVMELESKTGVILRGTQRTQINIYVDKDQFRVEKRFNHFHLPVMWLAVNIHSEELADLIEDSLYKREKVAEASIYAAIAVGAFFLLCAIIFGLLQITWTQRQNIYGLDNPGMKMDQPSSKKSTNKVCDKDKRSPQGTTEVFFAMNWNNEVVGVVAIDFGTSFSSYMSMPIHEYKRGNLRFIGKSWYHSLGATLGTPTTILLKPDKTFDSFGYTAEEKYADLVCDEAHHEWYYFEHFKTQLYDQIGLGRNIQLKDVRGKLLPAQLVITLAIQFIKEDFIENNGPDIRAEEVGWVLTVPAIWSDAAKCFMKEAAVKAGIYAKSLRIVLESEAASFYYRCGEVDVSKEIFRPGAKHFVLSADRDRVDITVHGIREDGSLTEIQHANDGLVNGSLVDMGFHMLLVKILGAKVAQILQAEFPEDYRDLSREFGEKLNSFTYSDKFLLRIPFDLIDLVRDAIAQTSMQNKILLRRNMLRLEADIVRQLFEVRISEIIDYLSKFINESNMADVKHMFIVGEFCEVFLLLQEAVKKSFKGMDVLIPPKDERPVMKGAIFIGMNFFLDL